MSADDQTKDDILSITEDIPRDVLERYAVDFVDGRIFSSRHVAEHDQHLLANIFMPLMFMNGELHAKIVASQPEMIFEYRSEAGPMAINGYPMFFSMRYISARQWPLFKELVNAIKDRRDADAAAMATIKNPKD